MITGKEPIYPQIDTDVEFADVNNEKQYGRTYNHTEGMNLRQHYAGLAMQAILTYSKNNMQRIAMDSVIAADALIEALNK